MSESALGPDPLKTARDLQTALEGMTAQLGQVQASVRRSKRVIAGLIVSLILDLALTVVVSVTAAQAHSASVQASATVSQLHATQISACQSGNQTRAQEIQLWTHLVSVSTNAKTTAAQRRTDEQLLAFVRATFAPRHCAAIYQLPG